MGDLGYGNIPRDLNLVWVCCKTGRRTDGQKHDKACNSAPPKRFKRSRLKLVNGKPQVEELPSEVTYLIEPEDLIGSELTKEGIKMSEQRKFTITLESQFIPTPTMVKNKLGTGYKVVAVELEREYPKEQISTVDTAVAAIIYTGYRALARAHHPDLGGDAEIMMKLNKAKKELDDLMKMLKG